MMKVDCGNCPLDNTTLGCHLKVDECNAFASLVSLSWDRALSERAHYIITGDTK